MSENIQNTENNKPEKSTEIDLGELFRMIGRGFSRLFAFISNTFLVLLDLLIKMLIIFREHILKFIIVGVLSIIVGWFLDSRKPTVYGSNMIIKINYESEQQLYSNLQYYNGLVEQSDSTALATTFNITEDEANSLLGIYIEPMTTELQLLKQYDQFMKDTDSVNVVGQINFDKFKRNVDPLTAKTHRIRVAALEKGIFKKLADRLTSLDVENDYVKTRKKVLYKTLENEEEALKKRLKTIDTLRDVYNKAIRNESKKTSQAQTQIQMSSSVIKTNELELFNLDQEILSRLAQIEREKELNKNTVNILSTFSEGVELRDFHDKYLYKIPFVTIALLLIFILLRELNKYLNNYAEKNDWMPKNAILITGGAGFIGANYIPYFLEQHQDTTVVNIDKLTYAGDLNNLAEAENYSNYTFVQGDICDRALIEKLFKTYDFKAVIHFAAESHVDNSIANPDAFIQTNIFGTFNLLDVAKKHWMDGPNQVKPGCEDCRFHHISTDEVYGTLGETGLFTEDTSYAPNSPYSASKASSDFIVRSYFHTYGMNVVTTNCSNNYGPKQHDEKLIPTIIRKAVSGENIPIYGDGKNIRDWLYVLDHCKGIHLVYQTGIAGETYNIGGRNERTNVYIANTICELLDELRPKETSYKSQITFVTDRPGHDFRYAIDASKIENELGWKAEETFESGILKTIEWYLKKYETK